MENDIIRLGKIKKVISDNLHFDKEIDKNIYLINDDLEALAKKYPETYLKKLEEVKKLILHPHYYGYEDNKLSLYRLYNFSDKFYLVRVILEHHNKWLFKALEGKAFSLNNLEERIFELSSS